MTMKFKTLTKVESGLEVLNPVGRNCEVSIRRKNEPFSKSSSWHIRQGECFKIYLAPGIYKLVTVAAYLFSETEIVIWPNRMTTLYAFTTDMMSDV